MILVTGAAGFIGYHVVRRLLADGQAVVGLDNLNSYYDPALKEARLARLKGFSSFTLEKVELDDQESVADVFARHNPEYVIHLAAQAGVRFSLVNPRAYIDSNITAFLHILEGCRHHNVKHLVFASSSSVYGANTLMPFSVHHNVDHPVSLYAATKKANELMAHSYSHLYRLPTTGLRFFTVYGPWGRPDMALFVFTKAILEGKPIDLYNYGRMKRDFTYIDDIVEGVVRTVVKPAQPDPKWSAEHPDSATSNAPFRLFNIGNHSPVELLRFVEIIEENLGLKAIRNLLPLQPGDVPISFADVQDLAEYTGFSPRTPIETGVRNFLEWYRMYYRI
jgi:UDP-glucuronate 4-epimerase